MLYYGCGKALCKEVFTTEYGELGDASVTLLIDARKEVLLRAGTGGVKAEKAFQQQRTEADQNARLRLRYVVPLWWHKHAPDWSVETIKTYTSCQRVLELSPLWNMALKTIRHRDIDDWQDSMRHR